MGLFVVLPSRLEHGKGHHTKQVWRSKAEHQGASALLPRRQVANGKIQGRQAALVLTWNRGSFFPLRPIHDGPSVRCRRS